MNIILYWRKYSKPQRSVVAPIYFGSVATILYPLNEPPGTTAVVVHPTEENSSHHVGYLYHAHMGRDKVSSTTGELLCRTCYTMYLGPKNILQEDKKEVVKRAGMIANQLGKYIR